MIGILIKFKRLVAGYDMKKFADSEHISVAHLSNIERGRRYPSIELLLSIEERYNMKTNFVEQDSPQIIEELQESLQSLYRGEYVLFEHIRERILRKELSIEAYFILELLGSIVKPEILENKKVIRFLDQILEKGVCSDSVKEAIYIYKVISANFNREIFQAIEICQIAIENNKSSENKAYLSILMLLFQWETGMRSQLLKELPEKRDLVHSVSHKDYFIDVWNYLYGQCMLYYGFTNEATHFLEKIVSKTIYTTDSEGFIRQCISKILLFSYTTSSTINKEEILEDISVNIANPHFTKEIEPYIYTFATVLIEQGERDKAVNLISRIEQIEKRKSKHPNQLFYEFMLNFHNKQHARCLALSEDYFLDEGNVANNPFQGVDICKRMIQIYEKKKQYKNATNWGKRAIKISNTYFGCKSLA